jgi:hypothetical protein
MEMGGLRNAGSSQEIQVVGQLAGDSGQVVRGEMAKIPVRFGAVHPEFVEKQKFQADMGQKETLSDFLAWGMETYPARHYLVIQAGHGNGHRGSMNDESTGSLLSLTEQREAFESAPHGVDVLLKESCMGASLEEAYEMKDTVGFYLGSQDLTKGSVDLNGFLREARLEARQTDLAPDRVVSSLTQHPAKNLRTFSAVDCSRLSKVGEAVAEFRKALDTPEEVEAAKLAAETTARVDPDLGSLTSDSEVVVAKELKRLQYRDAVGFAESVARSSQTLESQAGKVAHTLQDAIVYHYSDAEHGGQTGLSWNLSPDPTITAGSNYQNLALAKETGWTGIIS